jgi:hypothetical protein
MYVCERYVCLSVCEGWGCLCTAVRVAQSFLDGWLLLGEKEATEGLSKGRSAKCQARPVSRDNGLGTIP